MISRMLRSVHLTVAANDFNAQLCNLTEMERQNRASFSVPSDSTDNGHRLIRFFKQTASGEDKFVIERLAGTLTQPCCTGFRMITLQTASDGMDESRIADHYGL